MSMFGKSRKSASPAESVNLNLMIVPMLDMTFQVLFFLIMNFRMPSPEGQLDLFLPKEDTGESVLPPEEKLDKEQIDEYYIRLFISRVDGEEQGLIAGITFRPKDAKDAEPVEPDGVTSRDLVGALREKLKPLQPKEGKKQPSLIIEADNKLRYSELLRVMDALRSMKFNNIGPRPIPPALKR
jgi:biopolymer transport protein ExbD